MGVFLKWVTQCYRLNQARNFGTAINFPVYNIDQDFIIDTLMRSPLDLPPESSEGFRCEVEFPPHSMPSSRPMRLNWSQSGPTWVQDISLH